MTSLVYKLAKHITWLLFSDWRQGVGSRTNKPSRLKKNPVEYNRTRQFCTKRIDTLFPETDFGIFFVLFIDVIVSVCEATSEMKRNAVGSCARLKKWKGMGWLIRSIWLHLRTLKRGFSSFTDFAWNITFFQMRQAETSIKI